MGLVRGQVKELEVPGEPGQRVTIKKLPWGLLDSARDQRMKAVIERAKLMGGDLMVALQGAEQRDDVQTALADDTNEYDTAYLFEHAVAEWTYDAPLPEGTADLEAETAVWLKGEIVSFNRRVRTDDERLDGTSLSTSP